MPVDSLLPPPMEAVLVVLRDQAARVAVASALDSAGLPMAFADDAAGATAWLRDHHPHLALLDLTGPEAIGLDVLAALRDSPRASEVTTIALVDDDDACIARALELGADDLVRCPLRPSEIVARVRARLRFRETADELARRAEGAKVVLELTQALSSTLDLRSILFTVVQRIAEVARVDRCSIVLVQEGSARGYVVAASDDRDVHNLPISVSLYPEIQRVLVTRTTLVIEDASPQGPQAAAGPRSSPGPGQSSLFDLVGGPAAGGFRALALLPIVLEDRPMGVLFLRARRPGTFREHEMFLARTIANATAIALRNAHVLTSLRAESQAHSVARLAAERRLSSVQKYFDFFHAAADGLLVLDGGGRVLFANAKAAQITGRTPEELHQTFFRELFDEAEHARLDDVYAGFAGGQFPQMVDFTIGRGAGPSGGERVLQVSFSGALWHDTGVVLVSLRDVTAARAMARELIKTKEFLERVIDSSADAIVAADPRGTITLFSRAAQRLYGYTAEMSVGQLNARDLYPPGGAHMIKKLMLSPDFGGTGRLEGYRTEVLAHDGSLVPVLVSAAMILEDDRPIGSVGIITDLRERLRMERRLSEAQEELRAREKQAFIAELAGAAAHELNQPLTSVSGYAQLILRRLNEGSPLADDVRTILGEAERMAEIVRKIGKITRYETKSYVGAAKIVDLDRASGDDTSRAPRLPSSKPPPAGSSKPPPAGSSKPPPAGSSRPPPSGSSRPPPSSPEAVGPTSASRFPGG